MYDPNSATIVSDTLADCVLHLCICSCKGIWGRKDVHVTRLWLFPTRLLVLPAVSISVKLC